jgi:hypothetical protein
MSLATKAHRVVMSCRTPEQGRVAWQWLMLAAKRDQRIKGLLPYYANQLGKLVRELPSRLVSLAESGHPSQDTGQ